MNIRQVQAAAVSSPSGGGRGVSSRAALVGVVDYEVSSPPSPGRPPPCLDSRGIL